MLIHHPSNKWILHWRVQSIWLLHHCDLIHHRYHLLISLLLLMKRKLLLLFRHLLLFEFSSCLLYLNFTIIYLSIIHLFYSFTLYFNRIIFFTCLKNIFKLDEGIHILFYCNIFDESKLSKMLN